jgi:hypothetical protein
MQRPADTAPLLTGLGKLSLLDPELQRQFGIVSVHVPPDLAWPVDCAAAFVAPPPRCLYRHDCLLDRRQDHLVDSRHRSRRRICSVVNVRGPLGVGVN